MTAPTPCQKCKADLVRARDRIAELEVEVTIEAEAAAALTAKLDKAALDLATAYDDLNKAEARARELQVAVVSRHEAPAYLAQRSRADCAEQKLSAANALLDRVETSIGKSLPPELREDIWRHLGVLKYAARLATPCPRTYPLDPLTAEDPCEDCGRDERKHEIGPR